MLSEGGGFVFNAIHNVQAKTPGQNIVALVDAVREFQWMMSTVADFTRY